MTSESFGSKEQARISQLLKDYQNYSRAYFFIDLILTASLAWGSLWASTQITNLSIKALLLLLAYVGLYRGVAFIHEVAHFRTRIKGLGTLYNILLGFPNRLPYYFHEPHRYHHLPSSFGTLKDPEYLYQKGIGGIYILRPWIAGPLSPFVLALRFWIYPMISWALSKKTQDWVLKHASTLVVNPKYSRPLPSPSERKNWQLQDLFSSLYTTTLLGLCFFEILLWEFLVSWYFIAAISTTINIYRARLAHRYDNNYTKHNPLSALKDSVTVENSWFSFLWAPLNLQYHALHHLAPQIPYYNLKKAHQALKKNLKDGHPYFQVTVGGPISALKQYYFTLKER